MSLVNGTLQRRQAAMLIATATGHGIGSVHSQQIPSAVLVTIPRDGMVHAGILLVATVLVTELAFGSGRMEGAVASARSEFIAGISHDLRMPLAQILLAGETLAIHERLGVAKRRDLANSIVRESRRLVGLTGDRHLLREARVNLIDNSLKYGSPGQQVRLFADRAAEGLIHVGVEDQGPGIPKIEQQRVFDPYERLLRDQSSERTGAGL